MMESKQCVAKYKCGCARGILACLIAICTLSTSRAEEFEQEYRRAWQWLEERGLPDLAEAKLVKLHASTGGAEANPNHAPLYYLISEDAAGFRLLSAGALDVIQIQREQRDWSDREIKYEVVPQKMEVIAEAILDPPEDRQRRQIAYFGSRMSVGVQHFVFACYCAAHDSNETANAIGDVAGKALHRADRDGHESFLSRLASGVAHGKTWEAFVDFGDPEISRAELLRRFERIAKDCPDSKHRKRVDETITILRRMVAEDAAFAKRSPIANPTLDDRVADLIFQLRDQNGKQFSQPGSCDIFWDDHFRVPGLQEKSTEYSQAWQLKEIGFAAVPRLIEALDDSTFTRSVGYHRNFYFSHHVLRVGDCAERILSEIAGRGFYQRRHTNGAMTKDEQARSTKEMVEAWWREVQSDGEELVLDRSVRSGDRNSASQAVRLVQKFPERAVAAIAEGIRRAGGSETRGDEAEEDAWTQINLIQATNKLETNDALIELLTDQMLDAASLAVRVEVATSLLNRKRGMPVDAMIRQWKASRERGDESEELIRLVWFFVKAESPAAARLLLDDFPKLPIRLRWDAQEALGEALVKRRKARDSTDFFAIVEELVVAACADKQRMVGLSGSRGGFSYHNPRVCDLAGYFLSELDPSYEFVAGVSQWRRDLQLRKIQNVFRQRTGKPLLVELPAATNADMPRDEIDPLIDAFLKATLQRRIEVGDAIEAIGIAALPALRERMQKSEESSADRKLLKPLVYSLANRVTKVNVSPLQDSDSPALMALTALDDVSVTGASFVTTMLAVLKELPPGDYTGFTCTLTRDERMIGVQIDVALSPSKDSPVDRSSWVHNRHVQTGQSSLLGSFGTASEDHIRKISSHDEFIRMLDKALQADLDREVSAMLQIIQE